MGRSRLVLLLVVFGACRREETAPAPTARGSAPAQEIRPAVSLVPGLKLTIVPHLPDVDFSDVPWSAQRRVEVLAFDGKKLRLRWSGRVRVERPDSAKRRENWVRERANASASATPAPPPVGVYDEKEVSGTLDFPDVASSRGFLLPSLWPEGNAVLRNATGIWLGRDARRELQTERRTELPFFPPSDLVANPAAELLHRAAAYVREHEVTAGTAPEADVWHRVEPATRLAITIDGMPTTVPTISASSWFGRFEVLDEGELPLVIAALPDPPSSAVLDLFAPARVLKTLLGYRISAIERPKARKLR